MQKRKEIAAGTHVGDDADDLAHAEKVAVSQPVSRLEIAHIHAPAHRLWISAPVGSGCPRRRGMFERNIQCMSSELERVWCGRALVLAWEAGVAERLTRPLDDGTEEDAMDRRTVVWLRRMVCGEV